MSTPYHLKTADSLVGPIDWSLPHDEGCPGCEIERLEDENEHLKITLGAIVQEAMRRGISLETLVTAAQNKS